MPDETTKLRASLRLVIETAEHLTEHASNLSVSEAVAVLANAARAGLRTESDYIALEDVGRFAVRKRK